MGYLSWGTDLRNFKNLYLVPGLIFFLICQKVDIGYRRIGRTQIDAHNVAHF